jgi:hypothetical protein
MGNIKKIKFLPAIDFFLRKSDMENHDRKKRADAFL